MRDIMSVCNQVVVMNRIQRCSRTIIRRRMCIRITRVRNVTRAMICGLSWREWTRIRVCYDIVSR